MTADDPLQGDAAEQAEIALIWAQARGGVIGADGGIPWHLPEDLAHFREVTAGGTVVMGRRTWESLPERFRPLPGRRNIVVTRQAGWSSPGAVTVHSLDDALGENGTRTGAGTGKATTWIIGGGEIYRAALPHATRLEVTEVDLDVTGDTRAPEIGPEWHRTATPPTGWGESRTGIRYRFCTYRRTGEAPQS